MRWRGCVGLPFKQQFKCGQRLLYCSVADSMDGSLGTSVMYPGDQRVQLLLGKPYVAIAQPWLYLEAECNPTA